MPTPNITDRKDTLTFTCACGDITSNARLYLMEDDYGFIGLTIRNHSDGLLDHLRRWWHKKSWTEMDITKEDAIVLRDRLNEWLK